MMLGCAVGTRAPRSVGVLSPHQGTTAAGAAGTVPALLTDDGSDHSVSWDGFFPSESLHAVISPLQSISDSCISSTGGSFLSLGITSIIPACVGSGFLTDDPWPAQQRGLWLGCSDASCWAGESHTVAFPGSRSPASMSTMSANVAKQLQI